MGKTGKRNRWYICILLICIITGIMGCGLFGKGNVMEEMYRASIKEGGYSEFKKVKELEIVTYDSVRGQIEFIKGFYIPYKQEFLRDNFEVSLFLPNDEHGIEIDNVIRISDTVQINMFMDYQHEDQTLILKPLEMYEESEDGKDDGTYHTEGEAIRKLLDECGVTEQDIKEYQNYILYDVVMQTWVRRNYYERELTEQDYEDLQIEDHTFDFPS